MSPLLIVLLVCFVVIMLVWLLSMLGAAPTNYSPWLAWFSCLILGIVVFVAGSGAAFIQHR